MRPSLSDVHDVPAEVRLLYRNRRTLSLTEPGRVYFLLCGWWRRLLRCDADGCLRASAANMLLSNVVTIGARRSPGARSYNVAQ
jgi:hypothetical protein